MLTREEKLKAFELRLDGHSYREICELLNIKCPGSVHSALMGVIHSEGSRLQKMKYAAVRDWMVENDLNFTRLARDVGKPMTTIRYYLAEGGADTPPLWFIHYITGRMGCTVEYAFPELFRDDREVKQS